MSSSRRKYLLAVVVLLALAGILFFTRSESPPEVTSTIEASPIPTLSPVRMPETFPIPDGDLKDSIIAAGDYLIRQQLTNGELTYQVDFMTGERAYSPSHVRLMGGTGSLFIVCRVSGDSKYCRAGDLALDHYLGLLVTDPEHFRGTCFYAEGICPLGGAALTVDTIYKRWQATGDFSLQDRDLLNVATELGYFILSMRKPEGGFYQAFDPHFNGTADPDYYMTHASSQSLLAMVELHEMTDNDFWLERAREVNEYLISQPVTEDHWHAYAFSKLARLDFLSKADQAYANQIAQTIIAGEVRSLNPKNTSISTATKLEGLAALSQALYFSDAEYQWLDPEMRAFITFVRARQLPDNDCNWAITEDMSTRFGGGIFSSCDEPSIRIDGVQNWINGVTAFLEYQSMIKK
ncbi:hypothetical protein ANAEL_00288 [Anaerolineales bacterium]|nr:hypothetical protein ANAEL_00288 [Anaerolineales bacterium]